MSLVKPGDFRRPAVAALVLVVALLMVTAAGAGSQRGPTVDLSVAQANFGSSDAVLVKLTYSNPTKHTVHVLAWLTAAEALDAPIFKVTRDGQPVAYTGPIVKRPRAGAGDYVSLKAGEQLTRVVDLGDAYDLSQSGDYEIVYNVSSADLFGVKNSAAAPDSLVSASVRINVTGRAANGKPGGRRRRHTGLYGVLGGPTGSAHRGACQRVELRGDRHGVPECRHCRRPVHDVVRRLHDDSIQRGEGQLREDCGCVLADDGDHL